MKLDRVGQGPPLVFLHDWGFNAQAWDRQVEFFQSRYHLHLIDYNSREVPQGMDAAALMTWLGEGVQALLPEAPFGIVAHGLGGFIAFELIERGLVPEKLVLMSGLVRLTNGDGFLSGLQQSDVAGLRRNLADKPKAMLQAWYDRVFNAPEESPPATVRDCMPLHAEAFLQQAFDALIAHDYREVVPHLGCPTLILQGETDSIVPPWQATLLRGLVPGASVELCKGSGHAPFLTQYAATNRRIARFLSS